MTIEQPSPQTPSSQQTAFARLLEPNRTLQTILARAEQLALRDYYLVAGSLAQTAWNVQLGRPPEADIVDYDLVYHDPRDLSFAAEDQVIERARALFADLRIADKPVTLDVKNEARVHLWYRERFGVALEPYSSVEAAIDTFPTTATTVGVRRDPNGHLTVYTSFGLTDLLTAVVRPNKRQITRAVYEAKIARWQRHWPHLQIVPWDAA